MPKKRTPAPNLDGQGKPVKDTRAYDAAIARAQEPDPAREARLEALCLRYGVPVDMERPLREQTLIKAMCKDRPMWGRIMAPALAEALPRVTAGHSPNCVCQICYPKRVRTTPEFSK